jgi:hypothetical protein
MAGMSNWQPINTAPKNGRDFLACMFTDRSKKRVWLHTPDHGTQAVAVADTYMIVQLRWNDEADSFWDVAEGETVDLKYYDFWQEMPAKPTTQIEGGN